MKNMKNLKKFDNGLSIVQLEERFEMTAASRNVNIDVDSGPGYISVGTHFSF